MAYHRKQWTFPVHPLITNSHAQTVLGIHWPRRDRPYQAQQHRIELDDGDHLVIHEDHPENATELQPIVLLLHGLGGCHLSTYMCRMTEKLVKLGYRVFRMDMRGCGAGAALAKLPTHCGRSTDIASVLNFIAELFPEARTDLVAFSMGGTQSLNMLAEAGEMRVGNLDRTLAICPPINLTAVERHFHTLMGTRYDKFFVKILWQQTLARWNRFPETKPNFIPKRPRRLRYLDELVIAPSGGFRSAAHYYQKTSPGSKLKSIRQPVTIFSSEDDPVVPVDSLKAASHSSAVEIVTTPHGGHLGFLAARNQDEDFRWLDWRIIDWLQQKPENKNLVSAKQVQRQVIVR